MKDLTLNEKLDLLISKDRWTTNSCNGKLRTIFMSDGPVGVRKEVTTNGVTETLKSVAYPSMNVVASTWNKELVHQFGESLADDCIEKDVDILLGPGVNIKRNPLCGRNFEYFSEDPYQAGLLAKEYILGVQSKGIGTSLKHFACNNLEVNRHDQDSVVDERTLREIYYKPFEIAVQAKPYTIMSSYNMINGKPASENKSGFEILRKEYGFDGIIISDWEAVKNRSRSLDCGLDLEFPYRDLTYKEFLKDNQEGKVNLKNVDISCQRILDLIDKVYSNKHLRQITRTPQQRQDVSRKIQEEGIVLLKNDGILPLNKSMSVAVSGLFASPYYQNYRRNDMLGGGGSSFVERYQPGYDIPSLLSKEVKKVEYEVAFSEDNSENYELPFKAVEQAKRSDVAIVCCGTGAKVEFESNDRFDMYLPRKYPELVIKSLVKANKNVVVIIFSGSPIDVSAFEKDVKAIVYCGFIGDKGDEALVDILMGKVSPSGKLTTTWAKNYQCYPCASTYIDAEVTLYEEKHNVGYRYFDQHPELVRYPFGYGLSYSKFEYSSLSLEINSSVNVEFDIENVGEMIAKETAQIYVRKLNSAVVRPYKELKDFIKVECSPHHKQHVKLSIPVDELKYFDVVTHSFVLEKGEYEIIVASSSVKEELKGIININD